jgi:hypothetical protein
MRLIRQTLILAGAFSAFALPALMSISAAQRALAQQPSAQKSATESKEQYEKRIQAKLDELDRQMKALEAKGQTEGAEARREMEREYRRFSREHRVAARQLEQLKAAGKETWEKAKPQMDAALDELERAYQKLASQANKKGTQQ